VKIVYKNINDAFPLCIPGWQGKMESSLEAIKGAPVKMKAEYATKIAGLLYSLDDLNQNLMMTFRGVYAVYQADPCNEDGFFRRQVEKIIHDQNRLTTYRAKIRSLITIAEINPNSPEEVLPLFKEIANELGGASLHEAVTLEIAETRAIAKEWIGGKHGS